MRWVFPQNLSEGSIERVLLQKIDDVSGFLRCLNEVLHRKKNTGEVVVHDHDSCWCKYDEYSWRLGIFKDSTVVLLFFMLRICCGFSATGSGVDYLMTSSEIVRGGSSTVSGY